MTCNSSSLMANPSSMVSGGTLPLKLIASLKRHRTKVVIRFARRSLETRIRVACSFTRVLKHRLNCCLGSRCLSLCAAPRTRRLAQQRRDSTRWGSQGSSRTQRRYMTRDRDHRSSRTSRMRVPAKLGTCTKLASLRAGAGMIIMSSVSIFTILQFNTAPLMLGTLCSGV